jgi:hypothetical protein
MTRLAGTLFAAPFLLAGAFIVGIGCNWIPYDPASIHAPQWVLVTCGVIFICAGLAVLSSTWSRHARPQPVFGIAILLGLTAVANWVAFGPGERRFTSTTSIGSSTSAPRPVDDLTGRIVFGTGAILLDGILVAIVVRRLRKQSR